MSSTHPENFEGNFSTDSDGEDSFFDGPSSRRSWRKFALLLEGGSLALFAIFLVRLLPVLMEMKPMESAWQADLVDVLVNQGLLPFLGFVFLHLLVYIQPRKDGLRRRLRLIRRLAVIPVAGYLLLVPLQISSSIGDLNAAQARKTKYLSQEARLTDIRDSIVKATSIEDMNVRLQSLLEPALNLEQLNQPLAELRKNLLKANNTRKQEVTRLLKENTDNLDSFGLVISRVGSAVGWALAFASGAVPWGSRSTLLERARRR